MQIAIITLFNPEVSKEDYRLIGSRSELGLARSASLRVLGCEISVDSMGVVPLQCISEACLVLS